MIAIMSALIKVLAGLADREHALSEGEVLFRTGDPVRSMFVVANGLVRLVRHLPHGPALTLQLAGEGSVLAEASLFADAYHCDAVAAEPSRILAAPRGRVEDAVTHDPGTARAWAGHLAAEVQRARTQVEIVSLKTVAERLDAWLTFRGGGLPPKGQWQRVASEISVTPEALYRELARRR